MLPPPPGRLTTLIVELISLCSRITFSTKRAVRSLLPPGAEPTTISTFFSGLQLAPCATQAALAQASAKPDSHLRMVIGSPRMIFMNKHQPILTAERRGPERRAGYCGLMPAALISLAY